MQRREFLKALVAVPLAAVVPVPRPDGLREELEECARRALGEE